MHRTDGDGHSSNLFVDEDLGAPVAGTLLEKDWLNAVQEELATLVTFTGAALVKGTNTQVRVAVQFIAAAAITALKAAANVWTGTNEFTPVSSSATAITANGGASSGNAIDAFGGNDHGIRAVGGEDGYGLIVEANATENYAPLRVVPMTDVPDAAADEGAIYYNSTDHKLYVYNGTDWVVVGSQS
jgi:hypothetical protein